MSENADPLNALRSPQGGRPLRAPGRPHERGHARRGDGERLSAIAAKDAIAATLRRELAPIEEWLCRFLDPSGRTFSERELGSFGWPDVDPVALEWEEKLG